MHTYSRLRILVTLLTKTAIGFCKIMLQTENRVIKTNIYAYVYYIIIYTVKTMNILVTAQYDHYLIVAIDKRVHIYIIY